LWWVVFCYWFILSNLMQIEFINFTKDHLPLYFTWCEKSHVKEKWFREGYQSVDAIYKKFEENNGVYPYIIIIDGKAVGYIQSYDVVVGNVWQELENEAEGTVGFDLFIGEEDYVGKGYGTAVVTEFADKLFAPVGVRKIIVDPFADDKRAIRCYEKAGFTFARMGVDDVGTEIYIMEKTK
jgi:RimJ/RimL family protein N-acetyltransferase